MEPITRMEHRTDGGIPTQMLNKFRQLYIYSEHR